MVETDVPEQRLHLVQIGRPAEIVLDAFPDRRYRGKAIEIVPRVNRAKATATVKVTFVDPSEGVLPGHERSRQLFDQGARSSRR